MSESEKKDAVERMVKAYETMLERLHGFAESAEQRAVPRFRDALMEAREKAVELGELSREEAEKVSRYLERDMHDAAQFLADTGQEFRDWFRFDWQLVNQRLMEMFSSVADQTSLALRDLAERARQASLYHSEEVTGPGTLVCTRCGEVMHFSHVSRIPPCPSCHGREFNRAGTDRSVQEGIDLGDADGD
jgi:Zn finger protein HypA/HybF involved in hydrogenase expression